MLNLRRSSALLLIAGCGIATVALLLLPLPSRAQVKIIAQPGFDPGDPSNPKGKPEEKLGAQFSAIKLVESEESQQLITTATEYINDKNWKPAVAALQKILDDPKDFYAQVTRYDPRSGEKKIRWVSVKYEANNLLGSMASDGLDVYEVRWGQKAREILDEAKKKGDRELLADVAQRYMHTKAGMEANDLLATTFLDRGQYFMAALRFDRLLSAPAERVKLSDATLFKAALAYRRAGDLVNGEKMWSRLEASLKGKGGLKVGEQTVSISTLRTALDEIPRPTELNPYDWPRYWGNNAHSAQPKGSAPLLGEVKYSRPTYGDKSDEDGLPDRGAKEVKEKVDQALAQFAGNLRQPVMPGFFPIAAEGMAVYRTYNGITAIYLRDNKDGKAGSIAWKSVDLDGSLANGLVDKDNKVALQDWLNTYQNSGFLNLVYEATNNGVLATDHRFVYAVDDLAVPVPPDRLQPNVWNSSNYHESLKLMVMENSLQAFDLKTGSTAWRVGFQGYVDPKNRPNIPPRKNEFPESHFLGVPITVGGKLYVLNEKNSGELRLICLDPNKKGAVIGTPQVLGTIHSQHRVVNDISRRVNTIFLGYGEGILVCPTNAGELLGVDLMSRSLAWAYPYRQQPPNPNSTPINPQPFRQPPLRTNMALSYNNWKSSPPVIVDGKVVFTAPDSSSVHCINLRDGTPRWTSRQQDNDLYMAGVIDEKVVIVGKNSVRALRLSDGAHLWSLATLDVPSGQGVASNNIYYLPLRKGEVLAIDVPRGMIKAHNKSSKPGVMPGNLVFYEGTVLSQTAQDLVAYPQLVAKLEYANTEVNADPNSLDKLVNRGELYLADGQVQNAVSDLEAVLAKNPPDALKPRVREKMFEALTSLLQVNFDVASPKYLDQYRELCNFPENLAEQEKRLAGYLRILGTGREAQGNLVDAYKAYREFGTLPSFRNDGVPNIENPDEKTPTKVWLRGRVTGLLAKATPAQRKPLEDHINGEWQIVRAKKDREAMRDFVAMFDVPFQVGREARLELAETIMDSNQKPSFLEAELSLQQLRGPQSVKEEPSIAGRALEALARLEIKKSTPESMKVAANYYRELGTTYAQTVLRDGKTGVDLFNELTADKRILPYLEEAVAQWGKNEFKYQEIKTDPQWINSKGFMFEPKGDLTAFQRQHRLLLDPLTPNTPTLKLQNLNDGSIRWSMPLGTDPHHLIFFRYLYNQAEQNMAFYPDARFRFYHVTGHLAVFQVGTMVYGVDLENPKQPLWQHKLVDLAQLAVPGASAPSVQMIGQEMWIIQNQANQATRRRVGHVGVVQPGYVALTTQKGLVVLDPLRGEPLWTKLNIPPQTEIFGDEQTIYLVETSPEGTFQGGRALRASDGANVEVKDFGHLYRHRLRVRGHQLVVADPGDKGLYLRLYDIREGKDVWNRKFDDKAVVLECEDPNLAGVIEPNGVVTVVDVSTNKEVLKSSVLQGRVTAEDLKGLQKPLLMRDADQFYLALNHAVEGNKVAGGVLSNNFHNGLRCQIVNGWFLCFDKAGEFQWHLEEKTTNQMLVVEQFQRLPILVFTVRYNAMNKNPGTGATIVAFTGGVDKASGKVIGWSRTPNNNQQPFANYHTMQIDPKDGVINLVGQYFTSQFYLNDGRKRTVAERGPVNPGPGNPGNPATPPGLVPIRRPIIIDGGVMPVPVPPGGGVRRIDVPLQEIELREAPLEKVRRIEKN